MNETLVAAARTAPPETTTHREVDVDQQIKALRPWSTIVLDCNCHTFGDVIHALCVSIPGMTASRANEHAWEVHTTGRSPVASSPRELAELYSERLKSFGLRVMIEAQ